ncbi:MAG TPA: protein kinase [Polyangiaceae bacterium]|jgi:serine/threonine-protein kinase
MAEVTRGISAGDVLAGKYRVDRVLGAGAMGIVVAAHHLGLDNRVAIKLLVPDMLSNEDAVARFAREARAAAKITNEHVTRVLDVGTLENGAPYMVMEFLEGVDLHQRLQQTGPLPVEQAVDFLLQACEAISEAHELGIIHRDLKPANLFCVRRRNEGTWIKVLDFGISKMTTVGSSGPAVAMTRTSTMMGTPLYMSPEQMDSSRNVDARTDIWALGVVLFELLTAKAPFHGATLPEVCLKITTQPPPPLRTLRPDAPAQLEAVILKCLEKDRNNRWSSVVELCAALAPFAPDRAESAAPVRRSHGSSARVETVMASSSLHESQRTPFALRTSIDGVGSTAAATRRRKGVVLWAIGAAVTLGAVGSIAIAWHARSAPEATSSASLVTPPPATAATAALVQTNAAPAPAPVNLEPPSRAAPAETTEPIDEMDASAVASEGRPIKAPHRPAPAPHVGSEPRPSKATPKAPGSTTEPAAGAGAYDERL